jgi:large subunit ribosomal protein L16
LPLQPKTFKSKKRQKNRKLLQFHYKKFLRFGDSGLLILRPILFTSIQLSRLKIFLKRASRRGDKTRRKIWFHLFPHLPLSKKPANVRMGKGKGKLKTWFVNLRGGNTLVEYRNVRHGRILYFFRQMSYKLGVKSVFLFSHNRFFSFPFRNDKKVFFKSY